MQHNILDDSPGPEDDIWIQNRQRQSKANFSLGGRVGLKSVY